MNSDETAAQTTTTYNLTVPQPATKFRMPGSASVLGGGERRRGLPPFDINIPPPVKKKDFVRCTCVDRCDAYSCRQVIQLTKRFVMYPSYSSLLSTFSNLKLMPPPAMQTRKITRARAGQLCRIKRWVTSLAKLCTAPCMHSNVHSNPCTIPMCS